MKKLIFAIMLMTPINYMKLNKEKCHYIIAGHKYEFTWVRVGDAYIAESCEQQLLGIIIDSNLKFYSHVLILMSQCYYPNLAVHAILVKKNQLIRFFDSQFSYCPLVWVFHSKNKKLKNAQYNFFVSWNTSSCQI